MLVAALLAIAPGTAPAYDMPIGIPVPDFGPALGNPVAVPLPARPPAWPGAAAPGYYYIDNTAANATDSANTYGYPNRPRSSIPVILPAGSVVEVRGGPYSFARDAVFNLEGTASRPVFLYGVNAPVLDNPVKTVIKGSYFVFDGFVLKDTRIQSSVMNHAVIRNTEVRGNANTTNGVQLEGDHIVLYNDNIHHHQGDDKHGIIIAEGSHDIWVLASELHYNGGDGIQFCHACATDPPRFVYIGDNVIHGNRENGVDLKNCSNVVISQNEVYNHHQSAPGVEFCYDDGSGCTTGSSGSDGVSIVAGTAGPPSNVWILFNNVHDSNKGIRLEEVYNGIALGNVVHDVDSVGIEFGQTGEGPVTAAFNTIHNAATGFGGPWEPGVLEITMDSNIVSGISGDSISLDGIPAELATASNNLFYNDGHSISIRWKTRQYPASGAEIDAIAAGSGNRIGNPMFRNPAAADFHVLASGAGIDRASSMLVVLNERFRTSFGNSVSILRDFANTARSAAGTDHDIGAFESGGIAAESPPAPPLLY